MQKTDEESGGERGPFDNAISFREPAKVSLLAEFPPIGLMPPKRTKSWNNLTTSMSALKLDEGSADSLQMKLSLKKQIWTGAWNESTMDRTRPLSWGHTAIKTTSQYLVREYDSEQLLIACSKKLAAWQEKGTSRHQQHQGKLGRNKQTTGGGTTLNQTERRLNRDNGKGRLQKGFHVSTASFINRCNITRITELGKTAKKQVPQNYALAKIVEATDFITGLNNKTGNKSLQKGNSTSTGPGHHQKKKNSLTSSQLPAAVASQTQATTRIRNNHSTTTKKKPKFKTGGIVVTAVQHGVTPPKRIRSILPWKTGDTAEEPETATKDGIRPKKWAKRKRATI